MDDSSEFDQDYRWDYYDERTVSELCRLLGNESANITSTRTPPTATSSIINETSNVNQLDENNTPKTFSMVEMIVITLLAFNTILLLTLILILCHKKKKTPKPTRNVHYTPISAPLPLDI
ncbi:Oidioi.mRNA.OKI2018_I69.PAR.g12435.t1.cds [Oikopleura dioica]|uniref:Oidioi.mRNA.OKI2018_I69.PAR.g12435.t1.cds n=1 Tax=Oikopleura dioica TaxID=34765 RepID=A0ABN7S3Y7_OIKDI|nr:Oidioi.mRNA.OKI2018_I69.PAR.g12435.t1.cds [Oikopleura dioica]